MPSGFDAARPVAQLYGAFAKVKQLVADFWANEKFLSPCRYRPHLDTAPGQNLRK
jgi:hypothetical protein